MSSIITYVGDSDVAPGAWCFLGAGLGSVSVFNGSATQSDADCNTRVISGDTGDNGKLDADGVGGAIIVIFVGVVYDGVSWVRMSEVSDTIISLCYYCLLILVMSLFLIELPDMFELW